MAQQFEYETRLTQPREEVFAWHQRPGALPRLTPPFGGGPDQVTEGPTDGIEPGSHVKLGVSVPGTFGTVHVPWTARHGDWDPPRYFTDRMERGPLGEWEHRHNFEETPEGGTLVRDQVTVRTLPRVAEKASGLSDKLMRGQLKRIFAYRERQLRGDLDFHDQHRGPRLRVAVGGASGLIGSQVCALLETGGHEVVRLERGGTTRDGVIGWDPEKGLLNPRDLAEIDVVLHLGGSSIATRFTRKNKEKILHSRVDSTALLVRAIGQVPERQRPRALVVGSAVGYHGTDRGDEILTEDQPPGAGFLAHVCAEWEKAAHGAEVFGVRVINVRTGLVLTPSGGLLRPQLPLMAAGLSGPLGGGRQWQSWIGIDDMAGAVAHLVLSEDASGPYHVAAPNPVRQKDFARIISGVLHRPAVVPTPIAGPRALLGKEATRETVAASHRVDVSKFLDTGYQFRHEGLRECAEHILGRAA
ncbi:TIGR01777 family protein [Kocuria sp. cx-116]|uniref:TIGR01777 family oxidoreductase n=1 Tax=Kocuria sp. cx-116 TaxID=2771378 RepID=UPI0016862668|nr:TIGR01777 family oxidoreductase [Kocuria sp. cx-116]MBD2763245.1 TIGR01777 family protein [Kocuria sp. cx-116]